MGWRSLIITQHCKVTTKQHSLVVQTNGDIHTMPIDDLNQVIFATTRALISADAITSLAEANAKVVFSGRDGQPVTETANLYSDRRKAEQIRLQANWPNDLVETMWTKIVAAKINNQAQVVKLCGHDERPLLDDLDALELNDVSNREASAARRYFKIMFGEDFSRSDLCATNATLNYGYSILLSSTNRAIVSTGHITELGMHHHSASNPYNLGSDLMEPFRPAIDYWVAQHSIKDLTPDVKYALIDLLNLELTFNGKKALLQNALADHVENCLAFLDGRAKKCRIEVIFPDEVSSYAINDHV
ncbi:type II CRISPR-associated endonuclease Cas1 [Lacticaseibacillus chiayiensis]|uniref:type II CRISPR-associated endonuclease Cas1 n=1 Tax=Lacticaseibacillus chiayiensis TaxID=2100821 RepID=UPI003C74552B